MSKVTFTISMDDTFAEKFIGFLKNLTATNSDKGQPIKVESVTADEIVATPKGHRYDNQTC